MSWYLNDAHRLSATYMYNDSFNYTPSDGDLDEFEFDKHFYKRGAELTTYNFNWYADWNDRFSTEIRYSFSDVDFLQQAVAGKDFAEFRIELDEVDVYLGQDDSRQANALDTETEQLVIRGTFRRHKKDIVLLCNIAIKSSALIAFKPKCQSFIGRIFDASKFRPHLQIINRLTAQGRKVWL